MSTYTLHWEVEDGYAGKSRPHTTDFDSDWVMDQEDWDNLSEDEKDEHFYQVVEEDYNNKISFYISEREEN